MGNNLTSPTPGGSNWACPGLDALAGTIERGSLPDAAGSREKWKAHRRKADGARKDRTLGVVWLGSGSEPEKVSMPHDEFVKYTKVWVEDGMACPK
jgi:hypothetical protein